MNTTNQDPTVTVERKSKKATCLFCGVKIESGNKYCPEDCEALDMASQEVERENSPKPRMGNRVIVEKDFDWNNILNNPMG